MRLLHILASFVAPYLPDDSLLRLKKVYYRWRVESWATIEPDLSVVRRIVEQGDSVIDVGANIGVYTLALSRTVGGRGRVLSLEPVPPTFAILSNNVRKLRLANVQLVDSALSDKEGVTTMIVPEHDSGGENYYRSRIAADPSGREGRRTFTVATKKLDEVVREQRIENIKFIKIDVEGHEYSVITGAAETIRTWRPALLVEVSGNPDHADGTAHALFELLQAEGYRAYRAIGNALHVRKRGDRSVNYFFLTQDQFTKYAAASAAGV